MEGQPSDVGFPTSPACSPASKSGRRDTGKPGGRAEAARRLDEAHKLLEEVGDMLTDVRQELLRSSRRPGQLYRIG